MDRVFQIVYEALVWLSEISGMTYNQVNIVVYFILIPGIVVYLFGRIRKSKWPILVFGIIGALAFILAKARPEISNQLFDLSVTFLNYFGKIGLNYIEASVVVCVIVPLVVIAAQICFLMVRRYKKTEPGLGD